MTNPNKQCMFCKHHIKAMVSTGRDGNELCIEDECERARIASDEWVKSQIYHHVSPFERIDGYIYKSGKCEEFEKRSSENLLVCRDCKFYEMKNPCEEDSQYHRCAVHGTNKMPEESCNLGISRPSKINFKQNAESGQCFRWFAKPDGSYDIVAFGQVKNFKDPVNEYLTDDIWYNYFDLDTDYPTVDMTDPFMKSAYQYGSGIRILRQDLWETIVSFIISQRKSIPAIKTSIERLCHAYGDKIDGTEYYSFPSPIQLVDLSKDDCSLGYRKEYIERLSQAVCKGKVSLEWLKTASYADAKQALLDIHGVGEKVANCILLFGLGHIQACPIDVWVMRIINEKYNGVKPKWMSSPYAGYYQQLAFYYMRDINKAK